MALARLNLAFLEAEKKYKWKLWRKNIIKEKVVPSKYPSKKLYVSILHKAMEETHVETSQ